MSGRTPLADGTIVLDDVSKFYGDVLGVNRVSLEIPRGITGLVGPNGSGKSTLMNLITGLLRPSRGRITVLGIPTDDPERLFARVGYCTQVDSFPRGLTALRLLVPAPPRIPRPGGRRAGPPVPRALRAHGGRRPPGRRLLQGDAPAGAPRPGARPRPPGPGSRRAAQRARPDGPRRRHGGLPGAGPRGLIPHPPRA